ncbi:MAG: response regulator [Acidobacteria bacterium]|nr:response regulator [Acidobacteriota bacterium]
MLIVDAEESRRRGICFALSETVPVIRDTASPVEALKWLKEEDFDLILTDIHFPVMDGMQAVTLFRLTCPRAHLVILTSFMNSTLRQRLQEMGIRSITESPFAIQELRDEIMALFTGQNHTSEEII